MGKIIWRLFKFAMCCAFAIPFFKLGEAVDSSNALGEGIRDFLYFLRNGMCWYRIVFSNY